MEDRKVLFQEYYKIDRNIMRSFLEYDRYFEANLIIDEFQKRNVDFKNLHIIDYGCGVGDYGIAFLRLKAIVCFYDQELQYLEFVKFRCDKENLIDCCFANTINNNELYFAKYNFVIFGEVLEHLENPLTILRNCFVDGVQYIFTSAYPYVENQNYFLHHRHSLQAGKEQDECRKFLERNYDTVTFAGKLTLWTKK